MAQPQIEAKTVIAEAMADISDQRIEAFDWEWPDPDEPFLLGEDPRCLRVYEEEVKPCVSKEAWETMLRTLAPWWEFTHYFSSMLEYARTEVEKFTSDSSPMPGVRVTDGDLVRAAAMSQHKSREWSSAMAVVMAATGKTEYKRYLDDLLVEIPGPSWAKTVYDWKEIKRLLSYLK